MFKCEITGKFSALGEKLNRIVVKKREKKYFRKEFNEVTNSWQNLEIATGWEIVKEIKASDEGLKIYNLQEHLAEFVCVLPKQEE